MAAWEEMARTSSSTLSWKGIVVPSSSRALMSCMAPIRSPWSLDRGTTSMVFVQYPVSSSYLAEPEKLNRVSVETSDTLMDSLLMTTQEQT